MSPLSGDESFAMWEAAHNTASIAAQWLDEDTDNAEQLGIAVRSSVMALRERGMENQAVASCLLGVVLKFAFDS